MSRKIAMQHSNILSRGALAVNQFVPLPDAYYKAGTSKAAEKPIVNAMTVDVEDYYQVSAFDPYIQRSDWHKFPSRVEQNMDRILAMFDAANVKGTFFTLGCVAQKHPEIARKICAEGHELASHGWMHHRVREQSQQQFAKDIRQTKDFLEDLTGSAIKGYRAASYSIDETTPWAHDELLEAGYQYSSSVVPISHDHYGIPQAPRFPFNVAPSGMLEIPVSTYRLAGANRPCGGGGWFRLYPYAVSKHALKHVNEQEAKPAVFYFHPWEIDPDQPRQEGLGLKTRVRHYFNLSSMEPRLERLLSDFNWGRMDDIYLRDKTSFLSAVNEDAHVFGNVESSDYSTRTNG